MRLAVGGHNSRGPAFLFAFQISWSDGTVNGHYFALARWATGYSVPQCMTTGLSMRLSALFSRSEANIIALCTVLCVIPQDNAHPERAVSECHRRWTHASNISYSAVLGAVNNQELGLANFPNSVTKS